MLFIKGYIRKLLNWVEAVTKLDGPDRIWVAVKGKQEVGKQEDVGWASLSMERLESAFILENPIHR